MKRCALYRHFDRNDVLLYVGIADDPINRGRQHARAAAWAPFAARMTAEWLPCRAAAEVAERELIRHERPVYNRLGADGDADERIANYLRERAARGDSVRERPEEFVTLREAAHLQITPYDLATMRKSRRQRVRFPAHAGWSWGRRIYSIEALEEWASSLNFGIFGLWPVFTRSELRDLRRSLRHGRRRRTRGERGRDY